MAVSKVAVVVVLAITVVVELLLALAPATATANIDGRDLAVKVGIRRLLQDDCIFPEYPCCTFYGKDNCCQPDTYICAASPSESGICDQWCVRRDTRSHP